MKLRNKKTGIMGELHYEPDKEYHFTVATEDPADMTIYRTLAKLSEEWEDFKPADPLIEKESHRGVLRAAARMSGTDTAHVCKSDWAEVVIFEFNGKELCSVKLMDKGINTAHDGWYTIAELCGEEE